MASFALLDYPLNIFLPQIIRKMSPETLAILREISLPVDFYLAKEAQKRDFVATGSQIVFSQDALYVPRQPEVFAASSAIFRRPNEADLDSALKFWEDRLPHLDVETAMIHLAGAKISHASAENLENAEDTIDLLSQYSIGVDDLTLIACTSKATEQMLNHFQPRSFGVECCNFEGDGKIVEKIIIDQIYKDLREVRVVGEEYPSQIVEGFMKCFKKSESGLRQLRVSFPERKLPQDPFIGMNCILLNNFQNSFTLLIRSDSIDRRHVLLRGEREDGNFQLDFTRVVDSDDLLAKMLGNFYEDCPDQPCLGISEYSPSELRKFVECHW